MVSSTAKVMVCDDEPNMSLIVKRMLEREGMEVLESSDGDECLGKLKEAKPDLLLLDLMMPKMSGWDVLERIRGDEELRKMPIAILSVLPFAPAMLEERDLNGVADYIVKPFTYQQLSSTVNNILESMNELANLRELLADVDESALEEYRIAITNRMLHTRFVQYLRDVLENRDRYRLPEDMASYQRVIESEDRFLKRCDEEILRLRSGLFREYYKKALASANVGISIKTKPGDKSFHSLYFDIPIENSAIGRNCYNPDYEGNVPCDLCPSAQSLEDGKMHAKDIEAKDGSIMNVVAVPIKNPDGSYSALEVITDVTERRKREDRLERRNAKLEGSLELKELFIDIMRHDILNPLGVINGMLEYMELEKTPENLEESIGVIRNSCKKIAELVESARTYSKLETVTLEQFPQKDLSKVIEDSIGGVKEEAREKGIKIKFDPPGPFPANVNHLINGVFTNLLSNAIKYSPGKSLIEVEVKDSLTSWKIGIKDQGCGIPDEYKKTVFERFKRGERGGVKGTGLGLAIASKITEMHGGTIWVEDNPGGKGSIFYVKIPKKAQL